MSKRFFCMLISFSLLFSAVIGRIGFVSLSGSYAVSEGYNSFILTIDSAYPTLYYSNLQRINNNKYKYVAVIRQSERDIAELYRLFEYDERQKILEELKNGYPVIRYVDIETKNKANSIQIFKAYDSENSLKQLVSASSGGLLSYLDSNYATKKISFSIDAKGRILAGDKGNIIENNYGDYYGLKLTIDKNVQEIAYDACKDMKSGALIVMDVKTSKILACVSKPDDSYINKCFSNYTVGSVFKLVVAAAALENNIDLKYTCKGTIKVADTEYSCQANHIHGEQNIKTALANSCNCYFVNLALNLGAENIIETAKSLGFDEYINIYDSWNIKGSTLPDENVLNSKGQLSLLGFGQGKLLSTPLQICNSLCTIANNGIYNKPFLVEGIVDSKGNINLNKFVDGKKALSNETGEKIVNYMRYVVSGGTGKAADTDKGLSAGKTATAQTGQYVNGVELLNTWFAGVYPYNQPKYAIVVMTEQGTSGAKDCCPIFSTIVEKLD
ncbi:MAG: penicillin-binding transpeptidase domain-containing protein [Eubacterium sp.]